MTRPTLHLPRRDQSVLVQQKTSHGQHVRAMITVRGRMRQGAKKVLRWLDLSDVASADRARIRALAAEIVSILDQDR